MGIHSFYGPWFSRITNKVNIRSLQKGIEGILFDLNGLLHKIAQLTFLYGDAKKLIKDFDNQYTIRSKWTAQQFYNHYVELLTKEMNKIISELNPKQYIIMAVDGVAPFAKINQQRSRRYRDAANSVNNTLPPLNNFTSSLISPGTEFMVMINNSIISWINLALKARLLPPIIYYSSFEFPGEGEHKVFSKLREDFNKGIIRQGEGIHVIYGKDADLIILSLVSPVRNIFASREDLNENYSIDQFAVVVLQENMTISMQRSPKKSAIKPFKTNTLRNDFAVLVTLAGNDFIPNLLMFNTSFDRISNDLFKCYRSISAPLTIIVDGKVEILMSSLGNLFYELADTYEEKYLANSIINELNDEGTSRQRIEQSRALLSGYKPPSREGGMYKFNINKARNYWYKQVFSYVKDQFDESVISLDNIIDNMSSNYLEMLSWVITYYTSGSQNIDWSKSYNFYLAPFAIDICEYISEIYVPEKKYLSQYFSVNKETYGVTNISAVHQLLMITPPNRINDVLGVPMLAGLIKPAGLLNFIAPSNYDIFYDGKIHDYTGIPILPIINVEDIINAVIEIDDINHLKKTEKLTAQVEKKIKYITENPLSVDGNYEYDKKGNVIPKYKLYKTEPMFKSIIPKRLDFPKKIFPVDIKPSVNQLFSNAKKFKDHETLSKLSSAFSIK
jgi:5'-3' exonuclease